MKEKHFIKLTLGNKTYKDKVSTVGCADVADFKKAIKNEFSPLLDSYSAAQITLYEADGTTEIDPETTIEELFVTKGKPLIVKVEENPSHGKLGTNPLIIKSGSDAGQGIIHVLTVGNEMDVDSSSTTSCSSSLLNFWTAFRNYSNPLEENTNLSCLLH